MPPFVLHCARRCTQCEANKSAKLKKSCQPKTAKRFFGGPGSQSPSGQAKERTRILPVRRGFFVRRAAPFVRGGRFFEACRFCGGFCDRCPGAFSAGVPLPCSRPAGRLPVFVWPALPACRLAVVGFVSSLQAACRFCANFCARCPVCPPCALCAHFRLVLAVCSPVLCCVRGFSLLSFAFFCLTFASQISFHLSLRPRRASTFFRKESRQRFAKGLRPFEPHSSALRVDLPFPRAAGRLTRPFGPQTAG